MSAVVELDRLGTVSGNSYEKGCNVSAYVYRLAQDLGGSTA
jgi:hypothetical protein